MQPNMGWSMMQYNNDAITFTITMMQFNGGEYPTQWGDPMGSKYCSEVLIKCVYGTYTGYI